MEVPFCTEHYLEGGQYILRIPDDLPWFSEALKIPLEDLGVQTAIFDPELSIYTTGLPW